MKIKLGDGDYNIDSLQQTITHLRMETTVVVLCDQYES